LLYYIAVYFVYIKTPYIITFHDFSRDLSMAIMTSWVTAFITAVTIKWCHTYTCDSSNDKSNVGL